MEDKLHSQNSPFFAEEKTYQRFEEYLHHNGIDPRRVPFTELSFKVCGYGYFEKYKQHMKLKFREYLWESSHGCPELSSLKIIFNGFVVNSSDSEREESEEVKSQEEHILLNLLESVEDIVRKKKLKVFHFHTTNLRKCTLNDLTQLFNLINTLGSDDYCEEISIQMADWEFEGGYPEYSRLYEIFTDFVAGKPEQLKFKRFRLEMSSWYMK
jgi:Fe-S-cluster formation regulator IscX/YfhJ